MASATLNFPKAGKVEEMMRSYQTTSGVGSESPHSTEEKIQRQSGINKLRKETDILRRFYRERCKEVKEEPSVIDTYFNDRDAVIGGTEELIKVTKACISYYRGFDRVGGIKAEEDVESIISSLSDLVAVCEEFLWHVGVYDALQEPRTGKVCRSADEFVQELGF